MIVAARVRTSLRKQELTHACGTPPPQHLHSYEALGLVSTLTPIASGGTEKPLVSHPDHADEELAETQPEASTSAAASTSKPSGGSGLPKGYGKIIRDADGNIVDIVLGDDDDEAEEEAEAMEEELEGIPDPSANDQLAGWVGLGSDPRKRAPESAGTRVVQGSCYYCSFVAEGG